MVGKRKSLASDGDTPTSQSKKSRTSGCETTPLQKKKSDNATPTSVPVTPGSGNKKTPGQPRKLTLSGQKVGKFLFRRCYLGTVTGPYVFILVAEV
jgi:hypothetical protein